MVMTGVDHRIIMYRKKMDILSQIFIGIIELLVCFLKKNIIK